MVTWWEDQTNQQSCRNVMQTNQQSCRNVMQTNQQSCRNVMPWVIRGFSPIDSRICKDYHQLLVLPIAISCESYLQIRVHHRIWNIQCMCYNTVRINSAHTTVACKKQVECGLSTEKTSRGWNLKICYILWFEACWHRVFDVSNILREEMLGWLMVEDNSKSC